jgi:acyl-[acyl-carrier-protein]-phospholipid O-acyltransferase/long-chain-fatty-acid--[acyl-carrier-protein] ligase
MGAMNEPAKRPLLGLLIAQFFGAFNDNAWKMVVITLGLRSISYLKPGPELDAASQTQAMFALVTLTVPLMLFSIPAGVLADKISKRNLIVYMKGFEIVLMGAGTAALYAAPEGNFWPLAVLALMGLQSALFSPAKYGILPEILRHDQLSKGNGIIEMLTMFAIIAGTALGPVMLAQWEPWMAGAVLTGIAFVGFGASLLVPKVKAARVDGGLDSLANAWESIRSERILWLTVIGGAMYWSLASLVGQNMIVYSKNVLRLSDQFTGVPLAVLGLGIGIGAVLAGKMSAKKVEYGLIPFGAIGLGVSALCFGISQTESLGVALAFMALMGVCGGILVVPLKTILQWYSPPERRGAIIALDNVASFAGVLVGSVAGYFMAQATLSPAWIMVGAGILALCATSWALYLLPDALLRLVLVIATNTIYRIKRGGLENVPEKGGALLVCNHLSLLDGLFIMVCIDRPVRFIVEASYYNNRLFKPFMKIIGAIPISTAEGPKTLMRALKAAGEYLDKGELVCIFAEGQITRIGMLLPFKRGLERILKGRSVPVIPCALDRVWGSIFSLSDGRFASRVPRKFPYPVTLLFGAPLPATTPAPEIRRVVNDLIEEAWRERKATSRPLAESLIRIARRHPFTFAMADPLRERITWFKALVGGIALSRALKPLWGSQERVGILLPTSCAGALVNYAAALSARVAVNLNYTVGRGGLESAINQADLKTVVTSRQFEAKGKLELPHNVRILYLEEIAKHIGTRERLTAMAIALLPIWFLRKLCGASRTEKPDDDSAIIFSSGSTAEPKGVQLSHYNVLSNVEAAGQVLQFMPSDKVLGILPYFHSFGNLLLWAATHHGCGMVWVPNPLDGPVVGYMVEKYACTIAACTPTFLQIYMKRVMPSQFGSLRLLVTGAEKLPQALADAFEHEFGIRPLEGYGITECAPVISVNTHDFRAAGFYQKGSRRGSVGPPLPGVKVKTVDPESMADLPAGESGMLLVKGPNVMKSYLNKPELTEKAFKDGWYITGDIARVDEDGFIYITGRQSRFSKIGGEMVPHGKVEDALHECAECTDRMFAVTGVPCERKGEKLAVIHTYAEDLLQLLEKMTGRGLPNLFIPKPAQFVKVEALPVLGSGKLDLRKLKQIAQEALAAEKEEAIEATSEAPRPSAETPDQNPQAITAN